MINCTVFKSRFNISLLPFTVCLQNAHEAHTALTVPVSAQTALRGEALVTSYRGPVWMAASRGILGRSVIPSWVGIVVCYMCTCTYISTYIANTQKYIICIRLCIDFGW